jgi:hypothetical protein
LLFPQKSYSRWENLTRSQILEGFKPGVTDDDPFDKFLLDVLTKIKFNHVLELGSSVGNRLLYLQRHWPTKNFYGFEINKSAVKIGNETIEKLNIQNIRIIQKDITNEFKMRYPIDLVLTCATLIYISPIRIRDVFEQIFALKSKYLVFVEVAPYKERLILGKAITQLKAFPNWIHDYENILESSGYMLIFKQEIPRNVWSPGGGVGYVFMFEKSH